MLTPAPQSLSLVFHRSTLLFIELAIMIFIEIPRTFTWGGSGGATPIDAGFIYNEEEHDKPAAEVAYSWTLFLRSGGSDKAVDFNLRYAAGTTATLEFYVPQNDMVAVRANGQFARPGAAGSQSGITMLDGGATGWRQNGSGNILKRVTSMAQLPKSEAFDTGARVSSVIWSNIVVGGSAGAIAAWETGQTEPNGGVCNYPNSTVVNALDLFGDPLGNTTSSFEEVSINLQ
jgi:hypothetical protein